MGFVKGLVWLVTTLTLITASHVAPSRLDAGRDRQDDQNTTLLSVEWDVAVVGSSLGGVGAAVQAARMGARVVLFDRFGYPGGQATVAGVPTMDEGSLLLRKSGLYHELVDDLVGMGLRPGGCYFSTTSICPSPQLVRDVLREWLEEAGVAVVRFRRVDGVLQQGAAVTGVVVDGTRWDAEVVVDATETQALYPMVSGLGYEEGDGRCIQDVTWVAPTREYEGDVPRDLVPPPDVPDILRAITPRGFVDRTLRGFDGKVSADGVDEFPGWEQWLESREAWSPAVERVYRQVNEPFADPSRPRLTMHNYANDSPASPAFLNPGTIEGSYEWVAALRTSYLWLWWLYYELGVTDWGLADLGYKDLDRVVTDPAVPDRIERLLPPMPYIREGRRLVGDRELSYRDMSTGADWDTSVMFGAYFNDFHGCGTGNPTLPPQPYEVPLEVFIPHDVDGFLPGMARAAAVDRDVAASLRMQPTELNSGQVVGALAALASRLDVPPRLVDPQQVRQELVKSGAIVDL